MLLSHRHESLIRRKRHVAPTTWYELVCILRLKEPGEADLGHSVDVTHFDHVAVTLIRKVHKLLSILYSVCVALTHIGVVGAVGAATLVTGTNLLVASCRHGCAGNSSKIGNTE